MTLELIPFLHKATHQVGLYIDRHRDTLGVSQAEAHVLAHLSQVGSCSIGELHRSFGHKRSTLTSVINRLEKRGLLVREIHPEDRRSFALHLTRTGKPVANKVRKTLEKLEAAVLGALRKADAKGFRATVDAIEKAASE